MAPSDKSELVGNPIFESKDVMMLVIEQCLCGEDMDRFKDSSEVRFGSSVGKLQRLTITDAYYDRRSHGNIL